MPNQTYPGGGQHRRQPPRTHSASDGVSNRSVAQQGSSRIPRSASAQPAKRQTKGNPGGRPHRHKNENPKVKYNWFRALVMVAVTVFGCFFLAFFALGSASDLFGLEQKDQILSVNIPKDATLPQVTDILSDAGIVDQPLTFRFYTGFKYSDISIKPGEYLFNTNMGYDQIISLLRSGLDKDMEITLTFREGLTIREIADMLEEQEICEAEEFIEYLQTVEYNYDFFNQLPDDELRYMKLEGYLFPDTYNFFIGERVSSVAKKFFDNFERKISSDMQKRMRDLNLTLDEAVTLASVIQKEAGMPSPMRLVSSVFHNRLDNSQQFPRLQSDVTLLYVEDNIKPYLQSSNQPMYDAYNTYVREGLPIAPICNPGLEAIRAALYPSDTNYYFFVTDVAMEFYYAATSSEHYQNIRDAAKADETGRGIVHGIDTRY